MNQLQPARLVAHVLLIDDNSDDRELTKRQLAQLEHRVRISSIGDPEGLESALSLDDYDLVITDYALRWSTGLEVLRRVKARHPKRPVIMFTASGSEELAVEAMKEGLDDYITKTAKHYARIPIVVRGMLERIEQQRAIAWHGALLEEHRREAERQARISEERFRAVQEASPDGFTVLEAVRDTEGSIVDFTWVYANPAAARMAKRSRDWLLGRRVLEVHPGNRESGLFERYVQVVETGAPWVSELAYEYDE